MFPATSYSPTLVSRAVPLAQWALTSEFGMGSGVTLTLLSPEKIFGKLDKHQVQLQKRIISKTIRLISTTRLKSLLILHLWPINVVVSNEPYYHKDREI